MEIVIPTAPAVPGQCAKTLAYGQRLANNCHGIVISGTWPARALSSVAIRKDRTDSYLISEASSLGEVDGGDPAQPLLCCCSCI